VFWLLALALSLAMALAQMARLQAASETSNRFLLSLVTIEEATGALSDMETGNRGLLLTGDEEFRKPFYRGRDIFSSRYKNLLLATAHQLPQQDRLKTIKIKLDQWFLLYNPIIRKRHRTGISDQDQAVLSKCGALSDDIRFLLGEVRTAEEETFYSSL